MGLLGSYAARLRLHALRKKSVLLILLVASALVILCLQYNTKVRPEGGGSQLAKAAALRDFDDRKYNDIIGIGDLFQKDRGKSVQFLMAGDVTSSEQKQQQQQQQQQDDSLRSPLGQFMSKTILRLPPDQPSREEIARRRNALDLFTSGRLPGGEGSTTSGGLAMKFAFRSRDELRQHDLFDPSIYSMGIPAVNLDGYVPKHRLVHFDLKGAPPKVSFIKKVITLSKQLGATGLLLEYEDMFPFTGHLAPITAGNAYTKTEIEEILQFAKANDLEVIPLVQTFGHVEFALKLEKFANLREVPESPQALCPSNNGSIQFVESLIDQVMKLHPNVRYLHIGCDEVFQMGECPICRQQPRFNLFLSHVARVANYVRKNYPRVTPIIWDDMLRQLPSQSLEEFHLGELVEPMVWVYAEDIYRFVPTMVWEKYAEIFPRVWSASAFKGAFGETMYVPNVKRHLENNLRWLEVMTAESSKFKKGFAGIVLTGWQRYDHFAVLCELLPGAIPSLAVNLLATGHGYFNQTLRSKLYTTLNCQTDSNQSGVGGAGFVNFNSDPFMWNKLSRCFFPGSSFFKLLYRLHTTQKEVKEYLDVTTRSKGWLTDYNVRRNFTSPLRIDELMIDHPRIYHMVTSLMRHAREALEDIFDEYTIAEWIEQRIYPDLKRLEKLESDSARLKSIRTWPRRPFRPLKELTAQTMPPHVPLPPKR